MKSVLAVVALFMVALAGLAAPEAPATESKANPKRRNQPKTIRFSKKLLFVSVYQAANVADINRDGS